MLRAAAIDSRERNDRRWRTRRRHRCDIGAAVGAPGAGAAIGGALGAGTGYVVGNALQNQEVTSRQQQGQINYQQREIQSQRRQIQQLQGEQSTE